MRQSPTMVEPITSVPQTSGVNRGDSALLALVASFRPHQWVKNTLVFGGLIFSRSLFDWTAVWLSVAGFMLFCMASSGVYLLNDLRDLEQDRRHPVKRLRPLASGAVSPASAAVMMVLLLTGSVAAAWALRPAFALVVSAYVLLNVAYSLGLKRQVILDVMAVALGFVLRAVAGAVVIGVQASPWLILCTLMLALMVGFGKRRHELCTLGKQSGSHRASLDHYSVPFLDMMIAIAGASAVVMYALYTMAEQTIARFGSSALVYTTPFVAYGIFRYLYLAHVQHNGGDPSRLFVTDRPILLNLLAWVLIVCGIIYRTQ